MVFRRMYVNAPKSSPSEHLRSVRPSGGIESKSEWWQNILSIVQEPQYYSRKGNNKLPGQRSKILLWNQL